MTLVVFLKNVPNSFVNCVTVDVLSNLCAFMVLASQSWLGVVVFCLFLSAFTFYLKFLLSLCTW